MIPVGVILLPSPRVRSAGPSAFGIAEEFKTANLRGSAVIPSNNIEACHLECRVTSGTTSPTRDTRREASRRACMRDCTANSCFLDGGQGAPPCSRPSA